MSARFKVETAFRQLLTDAGVGLQIIRSQETQEVVRGYDRVVIEALSADRPFPNARILAFDVAIKIQTDADQQGENDMQRNEQHALYVDQVGKALNDSDDPLWGRLTLAAETAGISDFASQFIVPTGEDSASPSDDDRYFEDSFFYRVRVVESNLS